MSAMSRHVGDPLEGAEHGGRCPRFRVAAQPARVHVGVGNPREHGVHRDVAGREMLRGDHASGGRALPSPSSRRRRPGKAISDVCEEMLMIRPPSGMRGRTACTDEERRLRTIAITSSKVASDVSSIVPRGLIAALLTRMSMVGPRPSLASPSSSSRKKRRDARGRSVERRAHRERLSAARFDRRDRLLRRFIVGRIVDGDQRAVARQPLGDRPAVAAAGAGHHRQLAVEPCHACLSSPGTRCSAKRFIFPSVVSAYCIKPEIVACYRCSRIAAFFPLATSEATHLKSICELRDHQQIPKIVKGGTIMRNLIAARLSDQRLCCWRPPAPVLSTRPVRPSDIPRRFCSRSSR